MPIDFPDSPTDGQQFTSGSRTWTYNAAKNAWLGGTSSVDVGAVTGLGTDVATALAVNIGTAGALIPLPAFSITSYAASVALTFGTAQTVQTITLTGNLTLTASGYATSRSIAVRIISDSTARTLTFPSGWVFLNGKPATTTASKVGILSLTCFGSNESDVIAAWSESI